MAKFKPKAKIFRAVKHCVDADSSTDVFDVFSGVRPIEKKCKWSSLPGRQDGRRPRQSEYSLLMSTKQAIKRYYGVREKPFKNAYQNAANKRGSTADNLLYLLEHRLDNVVFSAGFASTRAESKQMVSHGHICVNDKRVNVSSYLVGLGDVISIAKSAKDHKRIAVSLALAEQKESPSWLEIDTAVKSVKVAKLPDLSGLHAMFKVNNVVEWYSK